MLLTNKDIEKLIADAEVAINGSLKNEKIKSYLLKYNYDDPRLNQGLSLVADVKAFYEERIKQGGNQLFATSALMESVREAADIYNELLTIGRLILKNEPKKMLVFSMAGERKNDFHGWRFQAEAFYNSILADQEILNRYANFGVTQEKIQQGLDLILKVKDSDIDQEGAKSNAISATGKRNNAVDDLSDWMHDFMTIMKLALTPEPQLLKAVGIDVKDS